MFKLYHLHPCTINVTAISLLTCPSSFVMVYRKQVKKERNRQNTSILMKDTMLMKPAEKEEINEEV
jgi:hypothetical protein